MRQSPHSLDGKIDPATPSSQDFKVEGALPPRKARFNPPESPAKLEFLRRMAGTLPETIVARDLEILNSGLHLLFADLRRAHRYFRDGEGNGRGGASTALGAVYRFIMLFEKPLAEGLQLPILDLQQALAALEENNVLPVFKPVRHRGRAKSSDVREALKGYVAGTVQRLLQTGINSDAAHRRVAEELERRGVRPERGAGDVTATTVRHWCDEVDTDDEDDTERQRSFTIQCSRYLSARGFPSSCGLIEIRSKMLSIYRLRTSPSNH